MDASERTTLDRDPTADRVGLEFPCEARAHRISRHCRSGRVSVWASARYVHITANRRSFEIPGSAVNVNITAHCL